MPPEDDTTATETAQEQDDFASGFSDKPAKATAKPVKPAEPAAPDKATATAEGKPDKPEYVQVTAADWAEVQAAARKTASYDAQLSKAFGTIGNLQKQIAESRKDAPVAMRKVEIPKTAFEAMARDFPELAEHNRAALEAALSGLKLDANDIDDGKIEKVMAGFIAKKEMEGLEDTYPDWRTIVGAVDVTKAQPDPSNEFRKWLGTKDAEYQRRINETESAAAIQRSIALFRRETRTAPRSASAPAKPQERADRFRAAVQPKGDGAAPAPSNSDNDELEAGFRSARG
jgi:hypothetical protein